MQTIEQDLLDYIVEQFPAAKGHYPLVSRLLEIQDQRQEAQAALAELTAAVNLMKHVDGCFCEAAFSGPGCHPAHSPECIALCKALNMKGSDSLSPEKRKELEAELSECREKNLWCVNENLKLQKQVETLVEALENIADAYANNEPISAKWAKEALASVKGQA